MELYPCRRRGEGRCFKIATLVRLLHADRSAKSCPALESTDHTGDENRSSRPLAPIPKSSRPTLIRPSIYPKRPKIRYSAGFSCPASSNASDWRNVHRLNQEIFISWQKRQL